MPSTPAAPESSSPPPSCPQCDSTNTGPHPEQQLSTSPAWFLCECGHAFPRKPGRPKLPPKLLRTRSLSLLVTEAEYAQITRAARRVDMSTSAWLRARAGL